MRRAPDSPDFRAPDSVPAGAWAADSDEDQENTRRRLATAPAAAPPDPRPLRLRGAIELYLAAKAAEGLSPRSIEWYRMVLERTARDLGADRPIDEITTPELRAWLLSLRETLAPNSVLGYYRASKAFGDWLEREGVAAATAFRALRRPRTPAKLIEPIPDDDLRRLLAVASVRDRAIVLLLVDTGLRVSEAAGIRLGDLRPDGTIKVMGKGSRERIVPVGPTARSALVRYLAERGPGPREDALFQGLEGGLTTRGIHQLLGRLKRRSGVEVRCNPHSLRHTFAHAYLVNGGDVFSLQRILGHSTLDMVRRYVALADTDVAARHRTASPADRLAGPVAGRGSPAASGLRPPTPRAIERSSPIRAGRVEPSATDMAAAPGRSARRSAAERPVLAPQAAQAVPASRSRPSTSPVQQAGPAADRGSAETDAEPSTRRTPGLRRGGAIRWTR